MNIFVTGGCGYKGHVLVPKLLSQGHSVQVLDTIWFGNYLEAHPNLSVLQGSVLDLESIHLNDFDVVIHLSSVANDPCGDLDPTLTWEVSCLGTRLLIDKAVRAGVKQFIYASSGSVYGVKKDPIVVESLSLDPISVYNKTKMVAEDVVLSYGDRIKTQIIRPATVCGLSDRMRFDVSVNLLTICALENNSMTVFGGKQVRPNIHIEDITDVYLHFISRPNLTGVFNAGFENLSILEIAKMVASKTGAKINITDANDPRSYRVNSDKLEATGFKPKKNVQKAIDEIIEAHRDGKIRNEPHFNNLLWMQQNRDSILA